MTLYQNKPKTVEAQQFTGHPCPGVTHLNDTEGIVETIQGRMILVKIGEWIVLEPDGLHYYPIADDVFQANYQPVEK